MSTQCVLVLKRQIFEVDIRTKADKNSLLCCSIFMSTQCVLVQSKQRLGQKKVVLEVEHTLCAGAPHTYF